MNSLSMWARLWLVETVIIINSICLIFQGLRSKTRTVFSYPSIPDELPIWNFDGSSTGQSVGHDSDIYIKPVAIYRDPMVPGENCLVMCETQDKDGKPHPTNHRSSCAKVHYTSLAIQLAP